MPLVQNNPLFQNIPFLHPFVNLCINVQADAECTVDLVDYISFQMAYLFTKPPFVYGAKLFQKNNRILYNLTISGIQFNMCGQLRFIHLGCDCRTNYGGAMFISNIVLYNQYRPNAALLGTDHRSQICIINVSSTDNH